MCKKLFIAATGQNCGKTTMSVSLMHLARKKYARVGFIKPIGPKIEMFGNRMVDMDAALMAKAYGLEEDIELMSPVTLHKDFTKEFLAGKIDPRQLEDAVVTSVRALESKYDFLIIEGAGHAGVGSIIGLNNARVAHLLGAPIIIVTGSGIGSVVDSLRLNMALFEKEGADVRMAVINKVRHDKRTKIINLIGQAFAGSPIKITGGFNYSPILANPTLGHISRLLELPLRATMAERSRIIHHIQLGAASSQRVVDSLLDSSLLVVTGSRDELLVTISSLYHIPEFREKIAGLIITGQTPVSNISQQIVEDSGIPYIRINRTTADVYTALSDDVAKITVEDEEKL
ncbi:MAG TPA: dethiobiotin synthase, partial [Geobacteraceae bacterium]|nr:dethiobiotin synthase [Geobacteraceae bacterium]